MDFKFFVCLLVITLGTISVQGARPGNQQKNPCLLTPGLVSVPYAVKARLHWWFLSRNSMQFFLRWSCNALRRHRRSFESDAISTIMNQNSGKRSSSFEKVWNFHDIATIRCNFSATKIVLSCAPATKVACVNGPLRFSSFGYHRR